MAVGDSQRVRLTRLEQRKRPPAPPPNPAMGRLLVLADNYRRELDELEPGPEPPAPSADEQRAELASSERFLEYLQREQERALNPETRSVIERALTMHEEHMELLGLQIASEEEARKGAKTSDEISAETWRLDAQGNSERSERVRERPVGRSRR